MNDRLHSYPKVWNLGHPNIADLLDGTVVVQEKIDGSQFSFGVVNGSLLLRSKGATVYAETKDKLFGGAIATATRLFQEGMLPEGVTYRGEAMMSHKHNALAYERAPVGNFILFDVDEGLEKRFDNERLRTEAVRLGLEVVPTYFVGVVESIDALRPFLASPSILGGRTEGMVIKNYNRWGLDGKMLMGKIVADDFREINAKEWKASNPTRADVIEGLIERYRTDARWEKAVQHLRDAGEIEGTPRDIGKLVKEVPQDVLAECEDEIKAALFHAFWPDIARGLKHGLPEWYKARLAEAQPTATAPES